MVPSGVPGELIGGIRYRAWHPPSALHPTIGADTPLVLHLHDQWRQCSIGGCTYHVAHPGGRSYEVFPVNALEAEARRSGRFEPHRHVDQVDPTPEVELGGRPPSESEPTRRLEPNPESGLAWRGAHPNGPERFTLDLRRR
jgi:hypothetical protein